MDFDDVNISSTICTWDTWYKTYRTTKTYRIHRIQEIQETQDIQEIQEIQEIDGGEGFAPQFRRKAGTPYVVEIYRSNHAESEYVNEKFRSFSLRSSKWGEALSSGLGFETLQGDEIPNFCQKRWVKISEFGMDVYSVQIGPLKKMKPADPKQYRSIILHSIWDLGWGFHAEIPPHFLMNNLSKIENFENF